MKKMRHSDEHKKRWFLLSVVDLSYYKSYQVRLGREGGREGGRRKKEHYFFLFPAHVPKWQVISTIIFECFISTPPLPPPPTFPYLPLHRTVSTGALFPSPTWMWSSRVPVSTTIVTPCLLCSEMKRTRQETSTFMQRMERFALASSTLSVPSEVQLNLCWIACNDWYGGYNLWEINLPLFPFSLLSFTLPSSLSSFLPSLSSLPLSPPPIPSFPLLSQFPIPSPVHCRAS